MHWIRTLSFCRYGWDEEYKNSYVMMKKCSEEDSAQNINDYIRHKKKEFFSVLFKGLQGKL